MLLADIPEIKAYPAVSDFLADHVSMQFGDVRSMLRLPLPGLEITYGCNFAITAVLCNLVSGISVSLYMPETAVKTTKKGRKIWVGTGETFKGLLQDYYPWQQSEDGGRGAAALYGLFRNPFAHALGVHGRTGHQIRVQRLVKPLSRCGLTDAELEELERSLIRPDWLPPGLSGKGSQWNVLAEGFYRDVFHMVWNLARDRPQMTKTEERLKAKRIIWRTGNP